jgi:hypothetical protein
VRSGTSPDKADHEDRKCRQVHFVDGRLFGVARQVALGLVDLGAHVGQRGVGIEAGFEFEQHEAAAFKGGRAHFLDVADRLELGFEGPKQQPLGILGANSALLQLHIDDRDADVRLRFLGDRHIGDESGQQQEQQRGQRQPRVVDGIFGNTSHGELVYLRAV